MKSKILPLYFLPIIAVSVVVAIHAVDYVKKQDGTMVETRTVTAGKLTERLGDIEGQLAYNNSRISVMTAEVQSLEAKVAKLRSYISTHTVIIAELEEEKAQIQAVLK